jgi:hypothetical protein
MPPMARLGSAMAYDPKAEALILISGWDGYYTLDDAWLLWD